MICIWPMLYKLLGPADVSYTMYYLDLPGVIHSPSITYDFDSASSQAMASFCIEQLLIARGELGLLWLVVNMTVVLIDTICTGVIIGSYKVH